MRLGLTKGKGSRGWGCCGTRGRGDGVEIDRLTECVCDVGRCISVLLSGRKENEGMKGKELSVMICVRLKNEFGMAGEWTMWANSRECVTYFVRRIGFEKVPHFRQRAFPFHPVGACVGFSYGFDGVIVRKTNGNARQRKRVKCRCLIL